MRGLCMLDNADMGPNWLLSLLIKAPDLCLAQGAKTSWQRSGSIDSSAQDAFTTICLIIQTSQLPGGKVHTEQNTWEMWEKDPKQSKYEAMVSRAIQTAIQTQ